MFVYIVKKINYHKKYCTIIYEELFYHTKFQDCLVSSASVISHDRKQNTEKSKAKWPPVHDIHTKLKKNQKLRFRSFKGDCHKDIIPPFPLV